MIRTCAVTAVSMVLCATAAASGAVNASGGSGTSTTTQVNDVLSGGALFWVVSSTREDVAHDPTAGPWQLTLKDDDGGDFTVDDSPTGTAVSGGKILNQLKVTGTSAWTGWTMRLSDANFIWSSTVEADTNFTNAVLDPPAGFGFTINGPDLVMTFDPLAVGTEINFRVEPIFVGSDGLFHDTTDNDPPMQSFTGSLGISQFPTVPEPAAISAALMGTAGLLARRRRQ